MTSQYARRLAFPTPTQCPTYQDHHQPNQGQALHPQLPQMQFTPKPVPGRRYTH